MVRRLFKAVSRPLRDNLRPDLRAVFGPEKRNRGRKHEQTNGQTNAQKEFYRTLSLSGPLPKERRTEKELNGDRERESNGE